MPLITRAGVTLYYELRGQGPPVLLIQGIGAAGRAWSPQVQALQHQFQLLSFDNRGLAKSVPCSAELTIEAMAEDALSLLDQAGWNSAHIMGHSMGGVIAQQLALSYPKRVRSLALLCTFPRGKDAARLTWTVLWMTFRTRLGTRRMRRNAFLEILFSKEYLRAREPEGLAAEMADLLGRDLAHQPAVVMRQLRAMARHDVSHRLGELAHIPTLVVSAAQDPIALPRYGRTLAAGIPGARYLEIPRASHGVPIEKPELINGILRDFLHASGTGRAL